MNTYSQTEFLKNLKVWGFKVNPFNKEISGVKNLINNHKNLEVKRKEIAFDIDGVVYKVNDFSLTKKIRFCS